MPSQERPVLAEKLEQGHCARCGRGHRQDRRVYWGLHALAILNLMDDVFASLSGAQSEPFAPIVAPAELPPAPVASPPAPPDQ
ncbi:hypothetical protein FQN51_001029 [Onygenales sp. PD_10]|nr:hypothetical protein FQN51_001029 [Onygenales sp. PD_10]